MVANLPVIKTYNYWQSLVYEDMVDRLIADGFSFMWMTCALPSLKRVFIGRHQYSGHYYVTGWGYRIPPGRSSLCQSLQGLGKET